MMNFLQRLFRIKEKRLSKIDYWKKWQLFELFDDLYEAERVLDSIFKSRSDGEKFRTEFIEELGDIEGANVVDFTRIWLWFSPHGEWDKVVGTEGSELRERIFQRTDRWKRNQEFVPGTKVSFKNEAGVVLDTTVENNLVGLIRWDTDKKNDVEDWRGLFESFLQYGGKIIDQDHQFKFIDGKGQLKKASR
jgi:hypothetical protein